ncbi:apolipoprotein D-like isoform X2 [Convolutriloba macropyga]
MLSNLLYIFIVTATFLNTCESRLHIGRCPDIPPVTNVTLRDLVGFWYEIEKFDILFEQLFRKCNSMELRGPLERNEQEYLHVTKVGGERDNFNSVRGQLFQPNNQTGTFKMRILRPYQMYAWRFSYNLISFEPNQYAVFYSCSVAMAQEYLWIYSPSRSLPRRTLTDINHHLTQLGINMNGVIFTDQINCPFVY